ncbi:hypothetical protein [Paenibacillus ferrarius]|uniref:hypothetical protein n=1 Tax=Paenibacillus ferrarius TaxID=1469647 RepID=UPI003D2B6E3E
MNSFGSSRNASFVFILAVLVTILLFMVFRQDTTPWGHWLVSLVAMILVELTAFGYVVTAMRNSRKFQQTVPAYLGISVVIIAYGVVVLVDILLFWLVIGVALSTYLYLHLITAALAGIGIAIMSSAKNVIQEQDDSTKSQTLLMKQLQSSIFAIKQDLSALERTDLTDIHRIVAELEENVKYSDPVGHPSLVHLEEDLLWQTGELHKCVRELLRDQDNPSSPTMTRRLVRDIVNALNNRNQKLQLLK